MPLLALRPHFVDILDFSGTTSTPEAESSRQPSTGTFKLHYNKATREKER